MGENPLVSVVIPVYNRANYVVQAIDSVLAQTYKNFEIIVVDDGSKEDVKGALQKYIKNKKIRYIYQKNKGVASARNTGIKKVRGEFIAFLDDDDIWLPKKLELQMPLFSDKNVGLVYGGRINFEDSTQKVVWKSDSSKFYKGDVFDKLLFGNCNFVCTSTVIVRKNILTLYGLFNEEFKGASTEDYDLWLRLAHDSKFDFTPKDVIKYRVHDNNSSHGFDVLRSHKIMLANVIKTKKRVFQQFGIDKIKQKKCLRNTYSYWYFIMGYNCRKIKKLNALFYYLKAMYYRYDRKQLMAIKKLFTPGYYK